MRGEILQRKADSGEKLIGTLSRRTCAAPVGGELLDRQAAVCVVQDDLMEWTSAEIAVRRVGFVTLPIGVGLLANPRPVAELIHGDEAAMRVIAVCDLILVPGLIVGRSKVTWMAARVVLNLGIAGYCLASGRRGAASARAAAGAMVIASIADVRTIRALNRSTVSGAAC